MREENEVAEKFSSREAGRFGYKRTKVSRTHCIAEIVGQVEKNSHQARIKGVGVLRVLP